MVWEVDAISAKTNSTTPGCEQSRSEMDRWKILHSAKNLKQKRRNVKRSADVSGNARHFCDCELNYTGFEPNSPNSTTQDASNRIKKQKQTNSKGEKQNEH